MTDLFYNDPDITSVAQIIQLIKNNEMSYAYLNENITNNGIKQLDIYLSSELKPTLYSPVLHQHINSLKESIHETENKDIEFIYNELIIDLFIETINNKGEF